jgi:hypothetical protein
MCVTGATPLQWRAMFSGPLKLIGALLAGLAITACGAGGSGYGCSGNTCTATFDGAASQEMSSELGDGAEVAVSDIGKDSVTVGVGGSTDKLVTGETKMLDPLRITLESIEGESVTLKVVRAG